MKLNLSIFSAVIAFWNFGGDIHAQEYPIETNPSIVQYEHTTSENLPEYLTPFIEDNFGNRVIRISSKEEFNEQPANTGHNNLTHPYSTVQAWNSDGTRLQLYGNGENTYILTGDSYQIVRGPIRSQKHWMHTNPNLTHDFIGTTYRVTDVTVSSPFPSIDWTAPSIYSKVTLGDGEGYFSNNDKYCVLHAYKLRTDGSGLSDIDILLFDREKLNTSQAPIVAKYENFAYTYVNNTNNIVSSLGWAKISPSGAYIVTNTNQYSPSNNTSGFDVYSFNLTSQTINHVRNLANHSGHSDIAVDQNGNEILFVEHNHQYKSIRLNDGYAVNYGGTYVSGQIHEGYHNGGHISGRNINRPGWVYVSANPIIGTDSSNNSFPLQGEVFSIKLDDMATGKMIVERFTKHYSQKNSDPSLNYEFQPQVTPNRDGSKVLFTSNMFHGASISDTLAYDYIAEKGYFFDRKFLDVGTDEFGGLDQEDWFVLPDTQVYPGDYNGDGKTDLVIKRQQSKIRALYLARATGDGFDRQFLDSNSNEDGGLDEEDWFTDNNAKLYPGDYNGDGKTDLFVKGHQNVRALYFARPTGDGFNRVFLASNTDGDGGTDHEDWFTGADAIIYTGDYNGDGRTDLFVKGHQNVRALYFARTTNDGFNRVFLASNTDGDGGTDCEDWFTGANAKIYTGDYNGDGKTDLFVKGHQNVRALYLARTTNDGFIRKFLDSNTDGDGGTDHEDWFTGSDAKIYTGDYNGDGKTDLFVKGHQNVRALYLARATNDGFIRKFLDSNTDGDGGTDKDLFFTSPEAEVYPGDYNGDGKTDLFVKGYQTNRTLYLARPEGDGFKKIFSSNDDQEGGTDSESFFTSNSARLITGDYDGDGQTDLLVKGSYGRALYTSRLNYATFKNSNTKKSLGLVSEFDNTESPLKEDVTIYPIPSKGQFYIKSNLNVEHIKVFTLGGRKLDSMYENNSIRLLKPYSGLAIIKIYAGPKVISKMIVFKQ